ncbi:MAG: hypothetical protein J1E83_02675 [Lachnospiraceae bacterium]|nr:hypothetical protein [Lachnospiraceae bacterium]
MEISTIYGNNYSAYTRSAKTAETEAAEKTSKMSEAEEMAAFKKEFYADLERITNHRTVYSWAVNISEKAFENMKADPEYRAKILSLIQRDVGDSYAPRNCSVLITVGATSKDYRADSWPDCNDSEYHVRSRNSFYKRDSKKKDRTEEINERYLEKRAQAKKLQKKIMEEDTEKKELEHSRLMKVWYGESRMTQASAAYEAGTIIESEENNFQS